jgi:hypothetical protein
MEQGNSSRPVPATEDVVENLQREVLEEGCASYLSTCWLVLKTCSYAIGTGLCSV